MYYKNIFKALFLLLCLLVSGFSFSALAKSPEDSKETLEKILQKGVVEKESLKAFDGIKKIYEENSCGLWTNRAAADFLKWLPQISDDGLATHFYHLEKIRDYIKKGDEDSYKIKLDVLLTDAALTLASNLAFGINITDEQKYNWYKREQMNQLLPDVLKAIENKNITQYLESLTPKDSRYVGLVKALQKYSKLEHHKEDWVIITKGPKLEEGIEDIRVRSLRKRLAAEGYLENKDDKNAVLFDGKLKEALIAFQKDHGLEPDGFAGAVTVETLNVPISERIKQIRVSLDRLREILPQLPEHYLLVDIPAFRLWVYENNNDVLTMKVIDGRKDRKTPLMRKEMQYVVLSPAWHVPSSIAIKDKLPELIKDSTFLDRNNMVLTRKGEDGAVHVVEATTVDWSQVSAENFDYQITQRPGDGNALGKVKFVFPNKDNIYLHDTSQRDLFSKDIRAFSSGCIRIAKPLDLALYVLQDHEDWDKKSITNAMNSGNQKVVTLKKELPVILTYFTAWGTKEGGALFGTDIYNYDQKVSFLFETKK